MLRHKTIGLSPYMILALVLVSQPAAPGSAATTVKIPDGTLIRLALADSLSSSTNQVDDGVNFEVTEDVKVGEFVAIPRGASGQGRVVEVRAGRRLGRAGKLNFSVESVQAPGGTPVLLRAVSGREEGDEGSNKVVEGAAVLKRLVLRVSGKEVNIPKGTTFNAYVDGDMLITLGGTPPTKAEPAASPLGAAAPEPAPPPAPSAPPPATVAAEDLTTAVVKSEPAGADVTVDGKYMGSTPSTLQLAPGNHIILIEKSGYKPWKRTMAVNPGGIVTIDATLVEAE